MKIVGFCGSPNPNGKTVEALSVALDQVKKEGVEVQLVMLKDYIDAPFDGMPEQRMSEKVMKLLEIVRSADGIIVATPVHWFSVSGLMKTYIDHLTALEAPNFALQGMPVASIAVCEEDGGTQACMQLTAAFLHLGCVVVPYGAIFKNTSMNGGELGWQDADLALVGANVCRMATLLKDCRNVWGYANMAK